MTRPGSRAFDTSTAAALAAVRKKNASDIHAAGT
jgi:hypothetical protein